MAKSRAQKSSDLQVVKDQIAQAKSIVFADYKGTGVKDLEALRREIKKSGGSFAVTKTTLAGIAFGDQAKVNELANKAQLAVAYSFEDEVTTPKQIKAATKKLPTLKILGGFFEGAFLSAAEMDRLASIPSREELIAKLLGTLQAPGNRLVATINNPASSLVRVLKAISEKTA